jgi:hypothetical protein
MHTIYLKKAQVMIQGAERELSTIALIRSALDSPPQDGFTFSDFKKRARVDKAISEAGPAALSLELEDADFTALKECVHKMRWVIRDPFVVDFVSQFE